MSHDILMQACSGLRDVIEYANDQLLDKLLVEGFGATTATRSKFSSSSSSSSSSSIITPTTTIPTQQSDSTVMKALAARSLIADEMFVASATKTRLFASISSSISVIPTTSTMYPRIRRRSADFIPSSSSSSLYSSSSSSSPFPHFLSTPAAYKPKTLHILSILDGSTNNDSIGIDLPLLENIIRSKQLFPGANGSPATTTKATSQANNINYKNNDNGGGGSVVYHCVHSHAEQLHEIEQKLWKDHPTWEVYERKRAEEEEERGGDNETKVTDGTKIATTTTISTSSSTVGKKIETITPAMAHPPVGAIPVGTLSAVQVMAGVASISETREMFTLRRQKQRQQQQQREDTEERNQVQLLPSTEVSTYLPSAAVTSTSCNASNSISSFSSSSPSGVSSSDSFNIHCSLPSTPTSPSSSSSSHLEKHSTNSNNNSTTMNLLCAENHHPYPTLIDEKKSSLTGDSTMDNNNNNNNTTGDSRMLPHIPSHSPSFQSSSSSSSSSSQLMEPDVHIELWPLKLNEFVDTVNTVRENNQTRQRQKHVDRHNRKKKSHNHHNHDHHDPQKAIEGEGDTIKTAEDQRDNLDEQTQQQRQRRMLYASSFALPATATATTARVAASSFETNLINSDIIFQQANQRASQASGPYYNNRSASSSLFGGSGSTISSNSCSSNSNAGDGHLGTRSDQNNAHVLHASLSSSPTHLHPHQPPQCAQQQKKKNEIFTAIKEQMKVQQQQQKKYDLILLHHCLYDYSSYDTNETTTNENSGSSSRDGGGCELKRSGESSTDDEEYYDGDQTADESCSRCFHHGHTHDIQPSSCSSPLRHHNCHMNSATPKSSSSSGSKRSKSTTTTNNNSQKSLESVLQCIISLLSPNGIILIFHRQGDALVSLRKYVETALSPRTSSIPDGSSSISTPTSRSRSGIATMSAFSSSSQGTSSAKSLPSALSKRDNVPHSIATMQQQKPIPSIVTSKQVLETIHRVNRQTHHHEGGMMVVNNELKQVNNHSATPNNRDFIHTSNTVLQAHADVTSLCNAADEAMSTWSTTTSNKKRSGSYADTCTGNGVSPFSSSSFSSSFLTEKPIPRLTAQDAQLLAYLTGQYVDATIVKDDAKRKTNGKREVLGGKTSVDAVSSSSSLQHNYHDAFLLRLLLAVDVASCRYLRPPSLGMSGSAGAQGNENLFRKTILLPDDMILVKLGAV